MMTVYSRGNGHWFRSNIPFSNRLTLLVFLLWSHEVIELARKC
jgi:hypothetical protein